MAVVKVENKSYTVEPLYQWDQNQVLEIRGLSLARVPEIHFATAAMSRAIVRQASMDAGGVLRVNVPNSLLQKSYTIKVYICTYTGDTFETLYKLEIPVKERAKPEGYSFEDDVGEIYSFEELENMVYNTEHELRAQYAEFTAQTNANYNAFTATNAATLQEAKDAAAASASSAAEAQDAAAAAAAEAVERAILKSDIVEIVKVTSIPTDRADNVLYVVI